MKRPLKHLTFAAITTTCALAATVLLAPGCISAFGQAPTDQDIKRLEGSPNYGAKDQTFINPIKTTPGIQSSPSEMINKMWNSPEPKPPAPIPVAKQSPDTYAQRFGQGVRVTWVGHSTVLVEVDGFRVLTDPIWSERCSPVSFAGPKRFHAPGIPLAQLPKIDAVIISHDHYDHLDEPTVKQLAKQGTAFYVPLGVGSHFKRWGIEKVKELDWWQSATLTDEQGQTLTLSATPARHFSGRGLFDRNTTQWASWAILGPKSKVYFGGDTGYFPGFKEIGERLGPFDLTVMPIGAYDKAWSQIHLNPEEAAKAHLELGGQVMMPIHWGTFDLAMHTWRDPIIRVEKAARQENISLITPQPGLPVALMQTRAVATTQETPWWRFAQSGS